MLFTVDFGRHYDRRSPGSNSGLRRLMDYDVQYAGEFGVFFARHTIFIQAFRLDRVVMGILDCKAVV